jgi:hypothetical protein
MALFNGCRVRCDDRLLRRPEKLLGPGSSGGPVVEALHEPMEKDHRHYEVHA